MQILFYIFSAIMLIFGLLVVLNRNPVSSALSLVMSFVGLAALFITLDAYFIGIIQILVYAGAVMVLFLFIIMLLDLKAERRRQLNYLALGGGVVILVLFVSQLLSVLDLFEYGKQAMPEIALERSDVASIGERLFMGFNLPLQVVGVLLLVATLGVVILSKKELK